MKPISKDLLKSYKSTTYTTNTPTIFHIKIGELNADLNVYMASNKFNSWTYITAENPFSKKLTANENKLRNQQLENEIIEQGYSYMPGQGIPENSDWSPEASYLIFNISRDQARSMAQTYQQNAFVFGGLTSLPELISLENKDLKI